MNGAATEAAQETGKEAGPWQGKKNIYVCRSCCGHIVTVDRDAGVTPFTTRCMATPGCSGLMQSSLYRVFDQAIGPDHEWYRPSSIAGLSAGTADHVAKGGLLLRKIGIGVKS